MVLCFLSHETYGLFNLGLICFQFWEMIIFFWLMAFGAKNALTKKFPWNTNVNVWMDVYGWIHMDGERIDNRRKKEKLTSI